MSSHLLIIFYLATLFLPPRTTKFTASFDSFDSEQKVSWIRQGDGWHATTETGLDSGTWSVSDLLVSVTVQTKTSKIDVSKFLKIETSADQKKQVSVGGHPVTVSSTESTITFTQAKGGTFAKRVVITYSSK